MKNPLPHPAVVVDWTDSASVRGEIDLHQLPAPTPIRSVGWLLKEGKESVVIAQECHPEEGAYRFVMAIPRFAVRGIRRLS